MTDKKRLIMNIYIFALIAMEAVFVFLLPPLLRAIHSEFGVFRDSKIYWSLFKNLFVLFYFACTGLLGLLITKFIYLRILSWVDRSNN